MPPPTTASLVGLCGAATAVALYRYFICKSAPARVVHTVLMSSDGGAIDVNAAKAALGAVVTSSTAESQVSDQPIGLDETLRGAIHRMEQLVEASEADGPEVCIAIQSGMLRALGGEEETWIHIFAIVVRDNATKRQAVSTSSGVQIPTSYVADWAEAGSDGTVGAFVAEETKCDQADIQSGLTQGQFSRAGVVEQAIRIAYATLRISA